MINFYVIFYFICFYFCDMCGADGETQDVHHAVIPLNRSSAPAQSNSSSNDRQSLVNLDSDNDNDNDNKKKQPLKKARGMSLSFPSISFIKKSAQVVDGNAKKHPFITPDILDDIVWEFLEDGKVIAKKIVEKDMRLKRSNFYYILKSMSRHFLLGDAYCFTCATYFLFSLLETENFKLLINPQLDEKMRGDYALCIDSIRDAIDILTSNVITWPSVTRKEDGPVYYTELLKNNMEIDISLIKGPYIGGNITIQYLPQLIERAPNYKAVFKELIKDSKNVIKYKNEVYKILAKQAVFVDKSMVKSTPKQRKKAQEDD